ncbi:MAG TPA: TIGR03009 domain-containing protein [Pirellulales bacterium]|jgi:TIGR03009 family protein|nr:TIGR03009 domain-containing protein [Pirellulales bacterium]
MSLTRLFAALGLSLALANLAMAQPLLPPREAVPEPQQPQPLAQPPFQIDRQQEANLDLLLHNWQQTSSRVNTFSCTFTLFEYNAVFGAADKPMRVEQGEIRYVRPDKGLYRVKSKGGEHWMCDGRAIYEFSSAKSQLIESRLPPELWGKAIADGPLPFVFGVDAGKLKQRYWMRITTPQQAKGQVWLEAYPRTRQDAANFKRVDIILTEAGLEPYALQMYEPQGKVRKVYQFADLSINSSLHKVQEFMGGFVSPQTPLGWRHIIQDAPVTPQPPNANPTVSTPQNPAQTQAGRQPQTR